ncbi:MAG: ATP-binding protein [Oceanospirillaceae bacterium]|nr:ATP-binding protein [Oceanospirillaceae bacterium]
MASANQLISLLKSHMSGDDPRFYNVAMQIAASEAKKGHRRVAAELKALIDQAKDRGARSRTVSTPVPMVQPKGELASLISAKYPTERLQDMFLSSELREKLHRVLHEQRQADRLLAHGLIPRHKLLLEGPPGSGKTMSACVLASELKLPLFTIRLDSVITRFLGDTASKLRQVFDAIAETRGVYLFDEFDAIGSKRATSNDVGEIRRVLNSFLQFLEEDNSNSLIIATTNHPELLDKALFRRFDDIIEYELPTNDMILEALKARLSAFDATEISWDRVIPEAAGLSQADIIKSCDEALKSAVLADTNKISESALVEELRGRKKQL